MRDDPPRHPDSDSPALLLAPGVRAQPDALAFTYTTARGPGGQNVNRRSTRAVLRLDLTMVDMPERARRRLLSRESRWVVDDGAALVISCEEHRSQSRNRQACHDLLREALVRALAEPKKRKKTRPGRRAIERRLQSKREQSERKQRRRRLD